MSMRARLAAVAEMAPRTERVSAALPRLAPRQALLAVGTLLQTVAFIGWMSLPVGVSGLALGVWPLMFLCAVVLFVGIAVTPSSRLRRWSPQWTRLSGAGSMLLIVALGLCACASVWAAADVVVTQGQEPGAYVSDAAAFNHFDAQLVLAGRDPYVADDAFWAALRQFPSSAATPLRRGRLAHDIWSPSTATLRAVVRAEAADPSQRDGAFAPQSLHSYPALSFLLYVPSVWAGLPSTLPISLLGICGLLLTIGLRLPQGDRLIGWALLLSNAPALLLTLRGSFEVFALLPVVLAWQWLPRRWHSGLLLGLGCAVKQVVWPLVPVYLVVCARRYGWREALRRTAIVMAAFLAPNIPFIVQSPVGWAQGVLLPMSLPLFPDGIGVVALAHAGLMPLLPVWAYTAIELGTLAGVMWWLARTRRTFTPEVALVLGLLPLTLAWRSLLAYFVWLPALALLATLPLLANAAAGHTSTVAASVALDSGDGARWSRLSERALRLAWRIRTVLTTWAAREEVRAALAATLALRAATSVLVPLLLSVTTGWSGFRSMSALLIDPWNHFDTAWYTDIAAHGYARFGSTAFMPLSPLTMRTVAVLTGGNMVAAGLLSSTVATFFAFEALYLLSVRLTKDPGVARFALFVAALLPTSFMLMAAYSDALFLALALWAVHASFEQRWGRVALLGALATLTRQQGVLLGLLALPAVTLALTASPSISRRTAVRRVLPAMIALTIPAVVYGLWVAGLAFILRVPLPWDVLSASRGWNQHLTFPGLGLVADVIAIVHPRAGVAFGGPALDAALSLAALGILAALWHRLPIELSLYLLATWCLSQLKVLSNGLTASEARYMLQLMPLVILPAGWLARGSPLRRMLWLAVNMLVGSACLLAFTLAAWVP